MNILISIIATICAAWIMVLPFILYCTIRQMVILAREIKKTGRENNE